MLKLRIASLSLLLSIVFNQVRACDICGCSVSNYNPQLFPHLSKAYIGLSFYNRAYDRLTSYGSINKELYNSLLLTGQYSIGKRIQVLGIMPYQFNHLSSEKGSKREDGIGDITLLGNVSIWGRKTKAIQHFLTARDWSKASLREIHAGFSK
jgi:hypothetical protein